MQILGIKLLLTKNAGSVAVTQKQSDARYRLNWSALSRQEDLELKIGAGTTYETKSLPLIRRYG